MFLPVAFDEFGADEPFLEKAPGLKIKLFADFFSNLLPGLGADFDGFGNEGGFLDGKVFGETGLALAAGLLAFGLGGVLIHRDDRVAGGLFVLFCIMLSIEKELELVRVELFTFGSKVKPDEGVELLLQEFVLLFKSLHFGGELLLQLSHEKNLTPLSPLARRE